jgi:tRNA(Ile)-lysidine synthase
MVADFCRTLGVPHAILTAEWAERPSKALQERARVERYRLLEGWAKSEEHGALVTAHQLDDQAETFLMRLSRGAGVRGLAAMRRVGRVPGGDLPLLRPLLGWRRSELEAVCQDAGVVPVDDPSNADGQFERVRIRHALAEADWLEPAAVVRSAANLAAADAALHWLADQVWSGSVIDNEDDIVFHPDGLPHEIRRRIVRRAVRRLATEGGGAELRGGELDRLIAALRSGQRATIRGVLCSGGQSWRFVAAPNRTRPQQQFD